jgi:hypothetical protein
MQKCIKRAEELKLDLQFKRWPKEDWERDKGTWDPARWKPATTADANTNPPSRATQASNGETSPKRKTRRAGNQQPVTGQLG